MIRLSCATETRVEFSRPLVDDKLSNNTTVEDNKLDVEDDQCLIDDSIKSLPLPVVLEKEIKIHKGCKSLAKKEAFKYWESLRKCDITPLPPPHISSQISPSSPYIYSGGRLPDSGAAARLNALSLGLRKASLSVENQQTASFVRSKQVFKSDCLVRSASAAVVESTSPSSSNPRVDGQSDVENSSEKPLTGELSVSSSDLLKSSITSGENDAADNSTFADQTKRLLLDMNV
ncbi:hypothetical protein V9T40_004971 [Parthenolecanium corni]|uniref:Uncharacterized protein n=1 Tax=Parthenolecanium corni TaxID=536013 RepID=A0AAN9TCY8_9HEMI